jgi:hypothetical protein
MFACICKRQGNCFRSRKELIFLPAQCTHHHLLAGHHYRGGPAVSTLLNSVSDPIKLELDIVVFPF